VGEVNGTCPVTALYVQYLAYLTPPSRKAYNLPLHPENLIRKEKS